jgi:predicted esterase
MNREPHPKGPAGFIMAISLGVIAAILIYLLVQVNQDTRPLWVLTGKLVDRGNALVYLPAGLEPGKSYPLVFALSPTADAMTMLVTWADVAEKHTWIVAASKTFQNGQDFGPSLQAVIAELDDVEAGYPVDTSRVIFTGLSGGGMGAHAVAKFYPDRVSAIVVNTGMAANGSLTPDYTTGKLAVFLASPTDFRYTEMQSDRAFLAAHAWKTTWIEFAGGHRLAPQSVYEQAAEWLDENLH